MEQEIPSVFSNALKIVEGNVWRVREWLAGEPSGSSQEVSRTTDSVLGMKSLCDNYQWTWLSSSILLTVWWGLKW